MSNGTVYQKKGRPGWYIQYPGPDKKQIREHGGKSKGEAEAKLRQRLSEMNESRFVGPVAERATVDELLNSYVQHLETKGAKSASSVNSNLIPVRAHFGEMRAVDVKSDHGRQYKTTMRETETRKRKGKKYQDNTINRGLQALRAAFNLARKEDRLSRVPYIELLPKGKPRQGFFERAEFEALVPHLKEPEGDIARFGYLSGWRLGEILPLQWDHVDRDGGEVRLDDSKTGEPRTMPIDEELGELLDRRAALKVVKTEGEPDRICPYVFHDRGFRLWKLPSWKAACEAAKIPGKLFHDFRRTTVRDLTRAGVPQSIAMSCTGHKTDSVFRTYNITSGDDKREAARRLKEYRAALPAKSNVVGIAERR